MQRRTFLTGAVAAGAAGTLAAPAVAQGKRELKMVTTWPKNFPGLGTSANRLAKMITDLTDGALAVTVFAAGELVPAFEAFDAVSGGAADLYHAPEYYWQGKSKAFNFFTGVPFGLTANEMDAWIHHGGGQKLWDELSARFNLKPFLCGNTGVQMGGWFRKEVNTLDDWKGLKMRMPGLGGEVLRRLGAVAVNLPGGEIFPALQSGAIDATEWIGPWNDLAFGFYRVARYYYYPGFHEPGSALCLGINKKLWDALTPSHRRALEVAATAENSLSLSEFNARNNDALDVLRKQHNVQLRKFSDATIKAIGEVAGQVVAEAGKGDPFTEKVYASFMEFRRKAIAWAHLAEQAYGNARSLPFKYG